MIWALIGRGCARPSMGLEHGLQRLEGESVDARLVHAGAVEVAGHLCGRALWQRRRFGGVFFGDGAEAGARVILGDGADGPGGLDGGHGMVARHWPLA